jgi:hypothetical protein
MPKKNNKVTKRKKINNIKNGTTKEVSEKIDNIEVNKKT